MPDVSTEVAIATTTLGNSSNTITFSSISSAYTDLRLVLVSTTLTNLVTIWMRFNGDTGTNYSNTYLVGDGTAAASYRDSNSNTILIGDQYVVGSSSTIPELMMVNIFSYAGSTYKTCLTTTASDYNGTGAIQNSVGLWRSTSAITSITLKAAGSANFATGTTATLYGIL